MSPQSFCCICRKLVFALLHLSFCCSGLMVHLQLLCLALSCFVLPCLALSCFDQCVAWIEQLLASSDVMQPLRQAHVASGSGQGLRHLTHFRQKNILGNRPRERPGGPWSHRKCPSGDPGAFGACRPRPGGAPATSEAVSYTHLTLPTKRIV